MNIAYVIQRYGEEIRGGAEQGCRMLAERLAAQPGWSVEVFTTCALDALTWADHYPAGDTEVNGVVVHRIRAQAGRHPGFEPFSHSVLHSPYRTPMEDQERWVDWQGPYCPELLDAVEESAAAAVVFYPYLYYPTIRGIVRVRDRAVMHPAAHDELQIRLPIFRRVFDAARAFVFQTDGERRLVERLFPVADRPQLRLGLGIEERDGDVARFRAEHGLGEAPYLLCLGRVDEGKGTTYLARFFAAYKERRPGPLKLVLAGPVHHQPPGHPDVVVTGPVDEEAKWGALRGALGFVHPSGFEAFSLVLMEAWAARLAVLVNARCAPTVEHVRRSGGGLAFSGYADFEAALDRVVAEPPLRASLAARGAAYAAENFSWPVLIGRYSRFLERVAADASR